jgi:hypothetical protein
MLLVMTAISMFGNKLLSHSCDYYFQFSIKMSSNIIYLKEKTSLNSLLSNFRSENVPNRY